MTQTEFDELQTLLTKHTFDAGPKALDWLSRQTVDMPVEGQNLPVEPSKGTWTDNQRKAFHKGCEELADYLNAHGKDMRAVLKHDVDIPWSKDTVKEFIFRPIMKAMYGYESHTELKKIEEVSKLWDVAMKHLGERVEVEYMEFPNDKARNEMQMWAKPVSKLPNYPVDEYPDGPTIT